MLWWVSTPLHGMSLGLECYTHDQKIASSSPTGCLATHRDPNLEVDTELQINKDSSNGINISRSGGGLTRGKTLLLCGPGLYLSVLN